MRAGSPKLMILNNHKNPGGLDEHWQPRGKLGGAPALDRGFLLAGRERCTGTFRLPFSFLRPRPFVIQK